MSGLSSMFGNQSVVVVCCTASDIDDLGQIVGLGLLNDEIHAFLLTPIVPIPAVSEWGTIVILLLLLSVGTVVFRQRWVCTG